VKRNLIIIHRGPEYERDFGEIAAKVIALDRDITVYHLPSRLRVELPSSAWQYPTLTVALTSKFRLPVRRGPILRNHQISKFAQQEILRKHGIPTPPALPFRFGMRLDPIMFGDFVVVKPLNLNLTSHGKGVMLFRRRRLELLRPQELAQDHPLLRMDSEFMVQRYVHTGSDIRWNRVSSFFSRPMYSIRSMSSAPRLDLSAPDDAIEKSDITNVRDEDRLQELSLEQDVLALAKAVHEALPAIPLLGIDILREERNGGLYVLEANPGGNTWHFSSLGGRDWRQMIGRGHSSNPVDDFARKKLIAQFGAFDEAAEVLAAKTHELAA
jgi:hypothetical protein